MNGTLLALTPAANIVTGASGASPETITLPNGDSPVIVRTDGKSFISDGYAVGQAITIGGSTANATGAGQQDIITGITASTITLSPVATVVSEGSAASPKSVTLQHNTDDFLNNLGRGSSGKQPNAGFRIKLG